MSIDCSCAREFRPRGGFVYAASSAAAPISKIQKDDISRSAKSRSSMVLEISAVSIAHSRRVSTSRRQHYVASKGACAVQRERRRAGKGGRASIPMVQRVTLWATPSTVSRKPPRRFTWRHPSSTSPNRSSNCRRHVWGLNHFAPPGRHGYRPRSFAEIHVPREECATPTGRLMKCAAHQFPSPRRWLHRPSSRATQ